MPVVIYLFSVSAFALGLAEFVPIGLMDSVSQGLGITPDQAGWVVSAYALGATFSAPILTAVLVRWSRKAVLLTAVGLFTLGSIMAAWASGLVMMLLARFVAGLGHGLFLAVASSTAARLVGNARAGQAVAAVFAGFTLAMALGVPMATWLSVYLPWRWVFSLIAVFGGVGLLGLGWGMKQSLPTQGEVNIKNQLILLMRPTLLAAASVTLFAYAGAFAAYTYIAPLLTHITGEPHSHIGLYVLLYGIAATVGNVMGGKLTDRLGIVRANLAFIAGILFSALLIYLFATSSSLMKMAVALLGFFTFAIVPALQARLLAVAHRFAPEADSVAAGLNIAGFNLAISLGAAVGGVTAQYLGLSYVGLSGIVLSSIGAILLIWQSKRD
ncbi:MFS transporter [Avibacterium paragallinarum]|uniref:MFS transporter n=1 Tax=Avibacterium paragallinarum TaxID=728 RepID=UPI00397CFC2A